MLSDLRKFYKFDKYKNVPNCILDIMFCPDLDINFKIEPKRISTSNLYRARSKMS